MNMHRDIVTVSQDVAEYCLRRASKAARHGDTIKQQRLLGVAQYWLDQADLEEGSK